MSALVPIALVALLAQADVPEKRSRADAMERASAAAEDLSVALYQRMEAGEALTPSYLRLVSDTSRRLCRMELARGTSDSSRTSLKHVHRAERLYSLIWVRFDGPPYPIQAAMTLYDLREAGLWLACGRAIPPTEADDIAVDVPAEEPYLNALIAPARDHFDAIKGRADAGEALTPTFIDLFVQSSRCECRVRAASTRNPAERINAAELHLARVKWAVDPGVDIAHRSLEAEGMPYFVAEAELWLALERTSAARGGKERAPRMRDRRRELVTGARQALAAQQERMNADEAPTPAFIELLCNWSRRLCRAEFAAVDDDDRKINDDRKIKALDDHLARMRNLHATLDRRFKAGIDVSRVQVSQARYFVAEAELWLAETTPD